MNRPAGISFKSSFYGVILAILIFVPCHDSFAQNPENTRAFLNGIRLYQQDQFEKSVDEFLKIAETGIRNGKLFYNLGNAYLKTGELGRSILWYERAFKLIPDDPDLNFNLEFTRSMVTDERDEKRTSVLKVLFFWHHLLSDQSVRLIAVISNLVFWLILASSLLPVKSLKTSTPVKVFKYLTFTIALVFTIISFYHYFSERNVNHGIILPEKISVRSGITENSTELFLLHSGTKVRIERQNGDYYRICFSEDKIGWLKKSEAAII